jgi:predicted secreted protein
MIIINDEKNILVIAHCLGNLHSRLKGIRAPPHVIPQNSNLIQLPCPEMIYLGLNRREITRDQLEHPAYRRFCRELIVPFADMIEQFYLDGYTIRILGTPKSPSCACEITSIGGKGGRVEEFHNENVPGMGIFYEIIAEELQQRGVLFSMKDATY